jgi:hypothetical protein
LPGPWAQETGVEVPDGLTKAEVSKRIDELQQTTVRGTRASTAAERGTRRERDD